MTTTASAKVTLASELRCNELLRLQCNALSRLQCVYRGVSIGERSGGCRGAPALGGHQRAHAEGQGKPPPQTRQAGRIAHCRHEAGEVFMGVKKVSLLRRSTLPTYVEGFSLLRQVSIATATINVFGQLAGNTFAAKFG